MAEDNDVNQRLVRRMLEKDGHGVTLVSDGESAIAAWNSHAFDVILMDVQMPGKDGLQATSAIREADMPAGLPGSRSLPSPPTACKATTTAAWMRAWTTAW
ncbi:MAG: response regulator [Paludibaculum sp.]